MTFTSRSSAVFIGYNVASTILSSPRQWGCGSSALSLVTRADRDKTHYHFHLCHLIINGRLYNLYCNYRLDLECDTTPAAMTPFTHEELVIISELPLNDHLSDVQQSLRSHFPQPSTADADAPSAQEHSTGRCFCVLAYIYGRLLTQSRFAGGRSAEGSG